MVRQLVLQGWRGGGFKWLHVIVGSGAAEAWIGATTAALERLSFCRTCRTCTLSLGHGVMLHLF